MKTALVLFCAVAVFLAGCESEKSAVQPKAGEQPQAAGEQGEILKKATAALEKGIEYLFSHQKEDGSILGDDPGSDQTLLGSTMLAVYGASQAPKEVREKFENKIAKGCEYILKRRMTDGSFQGTEGVPTYTTALAIMALQGADPVKYAEAVKGGQEYLIKAQYYSEVDPDDLSYGGWTYGQTEKGENKPANLSTTQFAVMALHETGVPADNEVFKRAAIYAQRSQNNSETNDAKGWKILNDGGFAYGPKMTRASADKKGLVDENGQEYFPSYASMTYAGFKTLLYANLKKNDPRVAAALNWIKSNYTLDKNTGMGYRENEKKEMEQQGLYYFYNAFAKAMDALGQKEFVDANGAAHNWAAELSEKLIGKQAQDGSWVNPQDRWQESLRTVVTGYSIDALDVCVKWLSK
jgi:squalene-hopene/tetraprenyl-beta-curcumene cyclase